MICKECGTENEKTSRFCENCGHSLKKPLFYKNTLTKKKKITIGVIIIVLFFGILSYLVGSYYTSPKYIASNYFEAIAYAKGDKLYQTLELKETSPFTSKKVVSSLLRQQLEDENINVVNYKVTKLTSSEDGFRTNVEISYTDKSSKQTETTIVTLLKHKKNKWLFFKNWSVDTSSFETIDQFTLSALKGSKLTIEGIDLTSYLNKEKSTDSLDVYELPAMFQTNYKVKATLPFGFDIEDTIMVSKSRRRATVTFDEKSLSKETREKLLQISKQSLEQLYQSILEKKNFADIKEQYQYENGDTNALERSYNQLLSDVSSSNLKSITFKNLDLTDLEITDEGYLYLSLKVNYDYTVMYADENGEQKEHTGSDYDYVNLTYDYQNEDFHFVSFKNLMTYFSRYL